MGEGELREVRVPPAAGRLDRLLADQWPDLSRSRVQGLIRDGHVTVAGRPVRASDKLKEGTLVVVRVPPPPPVDLAPEDIPLEILHLDADVVVVVKPAGLVVHPARGHWSGTLVHALLHRVPDLARGGPLERPGVVHRLDQGTSGVMVVALHDLALRRLQAQFMFRTVEREYLAVVYAATGQVPPGGTLESHLGRHPRDRLRFASVAEGGKRAVTHWRLLDRQGPLALVSCRLETGRTHQVRVHLTEAGLPLVGDPLYRRGGQTLPVRLARWRDLDHQLLHAARLGFDHPVTGARLRFHAPPPEDFRAFCGDAGLALPAVT